VSFLILKKEERFMSEVEEILSMLGYDENPKNSPKEKRRKTKISGSSDTYRQTGERILTLAKAKQPKSQYLGLLKENDILGLKYPFKKMSENDSLSCIHTVSKFIRKELSSITENADLESEGIPFLDCLTDSYADKLYMSLRSQEHAFGLRLAASVGKCSQAFAFRIEGEKDYLFFGPVNSKRKYKPSTYFFRNNPAKREYIVDTYYFLSVAAILNRLRHLFTDLIEKKDYKNPLFMKTDEVLEPVLKVNWEIGSAIISDDFKHFLVNHGYCLDRNTLTYIKEKNETSMCYDEILTEDSELYPFKQILDLAYSGKPIPLENLFERYEDNIFLYHAGPIISNCLTIFHQAVFDMYDYGEELKYKELLKKSIATAYITKKNIPQKTYYAMKHSQFNRNFGYVEFDEDVDLDAIKAVEEEFMNLNRQIFHGSKFNRVILRFRKLGKHKASGLYYAFLNTLCVDIRHPSSFMHEYFHMIDDQLDHLSMSYDFYEIVSVYRNAVREQLSSLNPGIKSVLNGRSIYNLEYYFRRAEIFARCGEMYLSRTLNIESSLLKHEAEQNFAYPKSERLEGMIADYFNGVLNTLKNIAA